MSDLKVLVNKIVGRDGKIDIKGLQDLLNIINEKIQANIFSNFVGRKLTVTLPGTVDDFSVPHGLKFIPNFAIIVKQVDGTPTVTFNFNKFTNKDMFISTDASVTIDVLVGRLDE